MIITLTIDFRTHKTKLQDIISIINWFNKHKINESLDELSLKLFHTLLKRCILSVENTTPQSQLVVLKKVGRVNVTRKVMVVKSDTIIQLFPPNNKIITLSFIKDLQIIEDLTNKALNAIKENREVIFSIEK